MDEKEQTPCPPQPAEGTPAADAKPEDPAKKAYKSPTIKRHGNLRLMTQLE